MPLLFLLRWMMGIKKKSKYLEWKPYNHLSPRFLMPGALIMCHFFAVNFLPFLFLFEENKIGGLIAALRAEISSSSWSQLLNAKAFVWLDRFLLMWAHGQKSLSAAHVAGVDIKLKRGTSDNSNFIGDWKSKELRLRNFKLHLPSATGKKVTRMMLKYV